MRVIFGIGSKYTNTSSDSSTTKSYRMAVGQALEEIEREATQMGADGVIGVHLSISDSGCVVVMGTAIKFQ